MEPRAVIHAGLLDAAGLLDTFRSDPATVTAMADIASLIAKTFQNNHKVLVAGNGGSMADAMHFAEEFTGRFKRDRRPYPVMPLGDATHLTCVANDYGFDHVFSRMVQAFGQAGDVLVLLSTSGNSQNLKLAAQVAREKQVTVVGLLGRGGGELAALCDQQLHAPGRDSDRIQELHMMALHLIIDAVEQVLGHE